MERANRLLADLQVEMDARYAVLLGEGRRKVEPGDGLRLVVVVVDELAFYTTGAADRAGKQARAEFADRLRDLVARGRAAGIIVLAATQGCSGWTRPEPARCAGRGPTAVTGPAGGCPTRG